MKPWQNPDLIMPDFGPDTDGKKEFLWKIMQIPKVRPGKLVASIGWGMIMAMLDMSIVTVALVVFAVYFDSSKEEIQWIVDGYSIALAAFSIIAGKIGDRFGAIHVNQIGMICFVVFSVLCTLAPPGKGGLIVMIVARALQGVSASFLMSTMMAIGTTLIEPLKTSMYMSYLSLMTTCASALGPTLGGLLTEVDWRLIFLINVPIGIIGIICTACLLPPMPRLIEKKFDIFGAVLTALFLALLVFGVAELIQMPWIALACIAVSIILVIIFCLWEIRYPCPILPRAVIFNYKVMSSLAAGIFNFATGAVVNYQGPFLLQYAWGYSPTIAGLIFLPQAVASAVGALVSGVLCKKYSASAVRWIANIVGVVGIVIAAVSSFTGVAVYIVGTVIIYFAISFFVTASNTYIMVITPVNAKGAMGGAVQCFRETGFSLGVAISCLFSEYIMTLLWGEDHPSMELPCPADFRPHYEYSYTWTLISFLIMIWLCALLVMVAGWHEYEAANNFKWMPKKTREKLNINVAANKSQGLDPFGNPFKAEQLGRPQIATE